MAALIEFYRFRRRVAANGFEGAFKALTIQATGFVGGI